MDVTVLYPSIDQMGSAKMVREAFLESDIEVENIDWKAASLYFYLTVGKEELEKDGLYQWVPRRKINRGRRPTVRNNLISGPLPRGMRSDKD